ncbi:MAG: NmrA family NAD(P)-binding protein [Nitriliruptorales bacterium]|nr:NmrA family NAD(P)-binding protein [Nitriliruptorales bacterium]
MILVTGAAGKTGLAVIAAVARREANVRALVHRTDQVEKVRAAGARDVLVGDQRELATLRSALEGVEAVYHIAPNVHPDEIAMGACVIAACRKEAVERVLFHSVIHPQLEAMPHHWRKLRVEEHLIESGLRWTILRPAAYLQNVLGYLPEVRETGRYRVPYGTGRPAWMVDLADVAEVAASALADDLHAFASYDLCGPDGLTPQDVAQALGRYLEREVEADRLDPDEWLERAKRAGMAAEARESLHAMFRHYDAHGMAGNPTVLTTLLGRPPRGLVEVLERAISAGST